MDKELKEKVEKDIKERQFPEIQFKMDILNWQNVKENTIRQINANYANLEIQKEVLAFAEKMIKKLQR